MLYVKPVPDVDILFTFVTVYLSVFSLIFLLSTSFWWNKVIYIYTLQSKALKQFQDKTNHENLRSFYSDLYKRT